MTKFLARLIPFILLGMAIVGFAFGLLLFAYLVLFGAAVGLILFAAAWIRDKFFRPKALTPRKKPGRTIDHS